MLNKSRFERELAEEMVPHRGLTSDARAFGTMALMQNHPRDVWIPSSVQDLGQDVQFGIRVHG